MHVFFVVAFNAERMQILIQIGVLIVWGNVDEWILGHVSGIICRFAGADDIITYCLAKEKQPGIEQTQSLIHSFYF